MPIADAERRYLVGRCGGADLAENPRHPSAEAADKISCVKPSRKDVMMHGCSPRRKPTGKRRAVCPDVARANLPGGTTARGPDRHIGLEAVAESR